MTVTVVSGQSQIDTFPVGTIIAWHNATAPAGWLVCDGSLQPIQSYPALYETITNNGTTFPYGADSGGSFRLPNLTQSCFPIVPTTTPTLPAGANSNVGATTSLANHSHAYSLNHSIGASGTANRHVDHNLVNALWNVVNTNNHNMQTNIGAVGGNVNAGANGNLNTAFRGHLHATNQGNQTTNSEHTHQHSISGSINNSLAGGSLHAHNFNVSSPTNYTFTNNPLVAAIQCVFIVLASDTEVVQSV